MSKQLIECWNSRKDPFLRNYCAWYHFNISLPKRPRWESRREDPNLMPTMFGDYSLNEFTSFDPHKLKESEIPSFTQRFIELFGQEEYERMVNSKLPSKAEYWVESTCKCGQRLYSFLQRLNENPFELSDAADSDSDSGNDPSPNESEAEGGNGNDGAGAPDAAAAETPPQAQSPQSQDSPPHSPPAPYFAGLEQLQDRPKCPHSPIALGPPQPWLLSVPGPSRPPVMGSGKLRGSETETGTGNKDAEAPEPPPRPPSPLLPGRLELLEGLKRPMRPCSPSTPNEPQPSGSKRTKL